MFETILQIIAPDHCKFCQVTGTNFCKNCQKKYLRFVPSTCYRCNKLTETFKTCSSCRASSPIFAVYKISLYEGPIKDLIYNMKFSYSRSSAVELGKLIARQVPTDVRIDFIVYIPTDYLRIRRRGFDHAKLIANSLGKQLKLSVLVAITRNKHLRQLGAGRQLRKKQIKGAFSIRNTHLLKAKNILLVDDVISTAATIEEAAMTLKQVQVKRIYVAVAAHNR